MRFRTRRSEAPDLNLTPLIDVVFLLLIFFMVSTTFTKESELTIELPEASGETVEQKPDKIEITISAEGRYYVNEQEVINTQLKTLKAAIKKVAGERSDVPLIISADAKTPHQAVVTAMDAARQLGILHLTFATRAPAEQQ